MDRKTLVSIGLSILSWRGAETLAQSLESYFNEDLFSLFDTSQLFLPDPDEAILDIGRTSSLHFITPAQNLGIMENMRAASEAMNTDYILLMENDCPLIETHVECRRQLHKALSLLKREDVIMARLRSIREPGQAFPGLAKYRNLYDASLKSKLNHIFRRNKIQRLTGYALYDGPNSLTRHPNYFEEVGDGFHLVDTLVMPWTNQSILIHRETFLNKIIPMARAVRTRRGANSLPNLEIELNKSKAWRNSGWKIACGPGLFTHERIGTRGYD